MPTTTTTSTPAPPTPPTAAEPACAGCQPNQLRNCVAIKCGADTAACKQTDEQKQCIARLYASCEAFLAVDQCNGDPVCCPSAAERVGFSIALISVCTWLTW
jgi:hypothetical protein